VIEWKQAKHENSDRYVWLCDREGAPEAPKSRHFAGAQMATISHYGLYGSSCSHGPVLFVNRPELVLERGPKTFLFEKATGNEGRSCT